LDIPENPRHRLTTAQADNGMRSKGRRRRVNWLSLTATIAVLLVALGAVVFLGCAWLGAQWRYQSEGWALDIFGGEDE
jgi:hypothetical protein